jgi:hypothetical protein
VDENINTTKNTNALADISEEACLEVNAEKTKFMFKSPLGRRRKS